MTKDWKDSEQYPNHITKATQQQFPQHPETSKKEIALTFRDMYFISFVLFSSASESIMNFDR